jgi:hypothetical protein
MTKQENAAIYAAYAELESAAEAFYAAADKLGKLVPETQLTLTSVCEDVNFAVVYVDQELDEVV